MLFKRICLVEIEIEPSSRRLAHGPEAMSEGAVPSTALLCSVEGTCLLWNSDGPCDEATASATSSSRSVSGAGGIGGREHGRRAEREEGAVVPSDEGAVVSDEGAVVSE